MTDHIPWLFERLASKIALKMYLPKSLLEVRLGLAGSQHSPAWEASALICEGWGGNKKKEALSALLANSAAELQVF